MSLCRALHTIKNGAQVSKLKAGLWTANELPKWATTIHNALAWREPVDDAATVLETRRFVTFKIDLITRDVSTTPSIQPQRRGDHRDQRRV